MADRCSGELVQERAYLLLAEWLRRSDREAHEPAERRDQLLVRTRPVAANENVRGDAAEREALTEPADREVHPTVLATAQIRQR